MDTSHEPVRFLIFTYYFQLVFSKSYVYVISMPMSVSTSKQNQLAFFFEKNVSATEIKHWNRFLYLAVSGIPDQLGVVKLGQNAYRWSGQDACSRLSVPSLGVLPRITWKNENEICRQLYMRPHCDRSCRSNTLPYPITVYWHRISLSQYWPFNNRRRAE